MREVIGAAIIDKNAIRVVANARMYGLVEWTAKDR